MWRYVIVYLALLGLLVATWGVAQLDLGAWNLVVAMTIAVAKALLVALFFMHLALERPLIWAFACAGLVLLTVGAAGIFADFFTRSAP
jgi:cytochrome c oxidase subunit 4